VLPPGPSTGEIEAVAAELQNGEAPAQTIDSETEPTTG